MLTNRHFRSKIMEIKLFSIRLRQDKQCLDFFTKNILNCMDRDVYILFENFPSELFYLGQKNRPNLKVLEKSLKYFKLLSFPSQKYLS